MHDAGAGQTASGYLPGPSHFPRVAERLKSSAASAAKRSEFAEAHCSARCQSASQKLPPVQQKKQHSHHHAKKHEVTPNSVRS